MRIIDRGSGTPVVIVPGIQGRWEWMSPAVDALSRVCRVITFSLGDEPSSGFALEPERGVENYLRQIDTVLETLALEAPVLMGVSYGGPIAAEFAVRRPDRVRALMLVSALPPDWAPDRRARFYLKAPLLFSPVFFFDAPLRASREIRTALPTTAARLRFSAHQTRTFLRCFVSPTRMATRLRWLGEFQFSDPAAFDKAVMIVTGEPGLDRVVRPELTERYLERWPHARCAVLERTGHLGVSTRPREFASLVHTFLQEIDHDVRASA